MQVLPSAEVLKQPVRAPGVAVVQVVSPYLIAKPTLQAWQTWVVPFSDEIWQFTSVATVLQLAPSVEGTFPFVQTLQTAAAVPVLWREKQSLILVVSETQRLVSVLRAKSGLQIAHVVADAATRQLLTVVVQDFTPVRPATSVAHVPL